MNINISQLNNINNSGISSENIHNNNINNILVNTSDSSNIFDITSLKPGDVFQGEILSMGNENITIAIDNQLLNARFNEAVNVCIGETLNFFVKESDNNQILISPVLPQENPIVNIIYKALDEAGLPATDKNYDIVNILLKNGMSVNKSTITDILSKVLSFPDADMENIVLLYKYDIDVNNENLRQFENYRNYQHQISSDLESAVLELPDFLSKIYNNSGKEGFLDIVNIIGGKSADIIKNQLSEKAENSNTNNIINKLFQNENFRTQIKNDMKEAWSIKPDALTKEDIGSLYDKLYKGIDTILKNVSDNIKETSILNKNILNLKENIEFMKELNNNFQFVQIPLKSGEKINQSDLYVYADKKKKYSPDEGMSVLLHLNMEHVGNLDIHVGLKNDKINARFSLENNEVIDIFKKNMSLLIKRLEDKGYTFNSLIEKSVKEHLDFVEDFLEADNTEIEIKRYSFDIKA